MKILYYIHGLPIGGAETITVNHILAMKENGVEVALVVYDDRPSYLRERIVASGIPFYSILPYCSYSILGKIKRFICDKTIDARKKWESIVAAEKPDVVHYYDYSLLLKDFPFDPKRSVMTFHSDVLRAVNNGGDETFSFFSSLADKGMTFCALSEKMKIDIRDKFFTENVVVTGNSIDVKKIRADAYDRAGFLKNLGIPSDTFVVGHVGRFHPIKNHERIVDIFSRIAKKRNDAYLLLIGGDQGGRHEVIRKKAERLGLKDRVLFLGVREDATRIVNCFDVLLLPSFSESFSLVLVEAQALGIRCVASDAVPKDVFLNSNCFRLSLNESDETWANIALGDNENDNVGNIFDFDVSTVIERTIKVYTEIGEKKKCP